jgi:hypothetical protein
MSETEDKTLGCLFGEPDPEAQRFKRTEYWYWDDRVTVGKMTVTRDGLGRFREFHYYEPRVINGEPTERELRAQKNNLGDLFG